MNSHIYIIHIIQIYIASKLYILYFVLQKIKLHIPVNFTTLELIQLFFSLKMSMHFYNIMGDSYSACKMHNVFFSNYYSHKY